MRTTHCSVLWFCPLAKSLRSARKSTIIIHWWAASVSYDFARANLGQVLAKPILGYGRVRVSMVFRSIQLQVPKELLGWEYGTLEVTSNIKSSDLSQDYSNLRLKIRTAVGKGKMASSSDGWKGKKDRAVRIAVRKRYSSCVVIEFRKNSLGFDKTPAYAVLWLKDIPDDEEKTVTLPVWKGDTESLKRAESSCDPNLGEQVGHIEVPLRFWPGLSGYHKKLAHNDPNLTDVMEILDTANDSKEAQETFDSGSDDDSSDSDEEHKSPLGKLKSASSDNDDLQTSGRRGPIAQIREYKNNSPTLHRKHRGLMQWKVGHGHHIHEDLERLFLIMIDLSGRSDYEMGQD